MKKVTFVDLSPYKGGAEISIEKLANTLNESFIIDFLVSDKKIWDLNKDINVVSLSFNKKSLLLTKSLVNIFLFLAEIIKNLKNVRVDSQILISNTFKSHVFVLFLKIFKKDFKWIIIERDMYENLFVKVLKRFLYKFSDDVIFNSNFLRKKYGMRRSKVLYNIVDRGSECKKDFKTFLYYGVPTYEKGYDRVFEVFEKINSLFKDTKLIIVKKGDSFFGKECKERILSFDLCFKSYDEIDTVLQESSFLLFFNRKTETFSRVVAESMSYGVIPIILKGNGMDDYVFNGYSGLVIESYDRDIILHRFVEFKKNFNLERISSNCKKVVEKNFSSEKIKKDFLDILGGKI
ncbi:MAG: glycosyltransferase family 4 protein [bacterium]|uniref:Glycosyl transferase, group 1 n=2 Tax=Bacteria candidate phyla TaxID=1783234 RepID=A0A101I359_UNCT6|nr:MAG: Glycosyl transferase, group 1 [candidate division TA06 bacterium 32_111]KUK87901.1 MAG: Glycosyl transferase, group 1 [candidate division TA06 bacterium 34_109]MDI6700570.1 glycosyltransferase family 4 protein [bacterium]HAF08054.1 hypothetical protein [candidate division WOR-3 bacterium]HCP16245.1 hypothetical protein [candidate division WOR-3 bacterium]